MRIFYSGILRAGLMYPISGGGFWTGFFSLLMLIPFIMCIRKITDYIRLRRHGEKTYAEVFHTRKSLNPKGAGYDYQKSYGFYADDRYFSGTLMTSFNRKYPHGKKITVCYDKANPAHHIVVPESLWECIALSVIVCPVFICMMIIFVTELLKCF